MNELPRPGAERALPPATRVRRIACLMLNGIGDLVCASPTIRALKETYPDARLTLLIRPHLRGLFDGSPFVDELLFYETDRPWKRPLFMWNLFRHRFDLWVDLHVPTFNTVSSNRIDFTRNAWLMRASRAPFRRAYAVPELVRHLSHALALPSKEELTRVNVVDMTLKLALPVGRPRPSKYVPILASDRDWASDQLPSRVASRVGLFFGSRQAADLWPDAHIRVFTRLLCEAMPGAELVLIGGEHDVATAQSIASIAADFPQTAVRDYTDRASFGRTAALLSRCDVLVSTDSGPMHIADAMQVPVVALFSSKNYAEIWKPLYSPLEMLNRPVPCSPCFMATCPVDNLCMAMIEPREVLAAVERLLGAAGTRRGDQSLSADSAARSR